MIGSPMVVPWIVVSGARKLAMQRTPRLAMRTAVLRLFHPKGVRLSCGIPASFGADRRPHGTNEPSPKHSKRVVPFLNQQRWVRTRLLDYPRNRYPRFSGS